MLLNRQQLAMSLSQLTKDDYSLLNDILIEYVEMIDDTTFNRLEDYVNANINELIWGCYHYYRVWTALALGCKLCYN